MKLDSSTLKKIIKEVLVESNGVPEAAAAPKDPATLAGGQGVQQQVLKRGLRTTGEEISQIEDFTPQEGKIIQRYIGLLQKAAEELSLEKGTLFSLLNSHFKKLTAAVGSELEKKKDTSSGAKPTEDVPQGVTEQCGPPPVVEPPINSDSGGGEGRMAKSQLYKAATYAAELEEMIQDGEELDGWVQAKITKASDYLSSVKHYLEYKKIRGN
jgi:hypothetical protein